MVGSLREIMYPGSSLHFQEDLFFLENMQGEEHGLVSLVRSPDLYSSSANSW